MVKPLTDQPGIDSDDAKIICNEFHKHLDVDEMMETARDSPWWVSLSESSDVNVIATPSSDPSDGIGLILSNSFTTKNFSYIKEGALQHPQVKASSDKVAADWTNPTSSRKISSAVSSLQLSDDISACAKPHNSQKNEVVKIPNNSKQIQSPYLLCPVKSHGDGQGVLRFSGFDLPQITKASTLSPSTCPPTIASVLQALEPTPFAPGQKSLRRVVSKSESTTSSCKDLRPTYTTSRQTNAVFADASVVQDLPSAVCTVPSTVSPCGKKFSPLRALSAYNFFFRDERERILHGGADDWTAARHAALLTSHWLKDRTKKRQHRKSHGMIDFTSLSKLISMRWKNLHPDGKGFFRQVAAADWRRYQDELAKE